MAAPANCPTCGARVDAPPGDEAYVYTCRFCGTRIPIEPLESFERREIRVEIVTPAPIPSQAASRAAAARGVGRTIGCVITLAALIPVAIPLVIFVWPLVKGFVGARFGAFPIEVGMNDSVEIADREATLDDTLITVGVNGKLTLRRCKLKGATIVKAGTNAQITIVDSTLEATKGIVDADEPNVVLTIQSSTLTSSEEIVDDGATNVKVAISKDSKLHADGIAFPFVNNGEVSIDHSTVDGKLGAIAIKNNGKVKLANGAVVKSDGPAIDLTMNGHLQVASSRVESKTTAVHASNNLEGTLRAATLVGPKASLDVGGNAHVTLAQSTLTGPKIVPKYSELDER